MKQNTERQQQKNSMKPKAGSLRIINKTDRPEINLIRIERQMTNVSGTGVGRDITTDSERRVMVYYGQ